MGLPEKYRKAAKNPKLAISYGIKKSEDIVNNLVKIPFKYALYSKYGEPTNQLTQDWDNLILLDACRFDTFAEVSTLDGDLGSIISPGSATLEWLAAAVGDQTFYDTVCVTAQPRLARYEDQFHAVEHVWNQEWDEELKVTPPKPVADAMRNARNKYPEKRLYAHFMQPHTPYIGEYGRENIGIRTGDAAARDRALGADVDNDDWYHALNALENGEIKKGTAIKAYQENLELVLEEVEGLIRELDGRTVVTADHGDLFGGWAWPYPKKIFDHPPGIPAVKLRQVPWFVTDGKRRETSSEPPQTPNEQIDDGLVSDRLQQLGYIEE